VTCRFQAYAIPKLGALQVTKLTRPKLAQWCSDIAASPRRTNQKHAHENGLRVQTEEGLRKRQATANRIMRRLRAALNLALEEGRTFANPIAWKVPPFENVEVARAIFLSEKDQRTFVKACAKEKAFQRLVRAGLYAGARYGELGRLVVRDFNASAGTLFIAKSKGGQQRYVYLDAEAARFFREVCTNRDLSEEMFLRESGKPWAKDSQKKPMRHACTLAGMKPFGFHQLRHSAASRWIRRVSTTLRQVFAKFSEFFMCWGFPQKNFAPGSPRSDDFQLGRPTVSPLLSFFKRISHLQS
jgi:integrase